MLTVRGLASEMGLELAAGEDGADAPVRWVHISELPDPTPWLSGGELLLTTGIQLDTDERQREFVRLLSGHHLAGLGFGTGFDHETLPPALLEVVRALAAATGGAVCVLSGRGETISSKAFRRQLPEDALEQVRAEIVRRGEELSNGSARSGENAEFAPDHPDIAGRSLVLPVSLRGRGAPQAWLVAARDTGGLGDFERLILQQAVTVVALELMRQRAMRDTERRLAGDVLAEALTGRLSEEELAMRLRPFGIGQSAAVLVFGGPDGAPAPQAEAELDRFLADANVGALVATRERLLCAVVDAHDNVDPVALAGRAREAISEDAGALRAAASRAAPVGALRRTFHEARCALEAAALVNGSSPPVASYRDL